MSADASVIRILVVDDHSIVRQGVVGLVGGQPDMSIVGQASNGREAIQQFRAHHPDVVLMDLQMPEMNGLDALIAIRDEAPRRESLYYHVRWRRSGTARDQSRRSGLLAEKRLASGTAGDHPGRPCREKVAIG